MNSETATGPARWKLVVVTACGLALLAGCASSSTRRAARLRRPVDLIVRGGLGVEFGPVR